MGSTAHQHHRPPLAQASRLRARARAWAQGLAGAGQGGLVSCSVDLCTMAVVLAAFGQAPRRWIAGLDRQAEAVLGWGLGPTGQRAARVAAQSGARLWRLEDGFLRSYAPHDPPLSVVIDGQGMHYDPTAPSDLEAHVTAPLGPGARARARRIIAAWRALGLSKWNAARAPEAVLPPRYVLVVEQVAGDRALAHAPADASARMLAAARAEAGGAQIVIRRHPAARAGRGSLQGLDLSGCTVLGPEGHPADLIAGAAAVYTVSSQMGFEALIWGRRLRCFGMPFYAGWGLSGDALAPPARRSPVALESLVHGALVGYARYVDPETGAPCEVEQVMAHLGRRRRLAEALPRRALAVGFSPWKRPHLRRFLEGAALGFAPRAPAAPATPAPATPALVRWGTAGARADLRVEDGFLRSVGLGAALTAPLSWTVDGDGLHYDPARPSALEQMLAQAAFSPALLARAARLRGQIVAAGVTKYNLSAPPWQRPPGARRVVLVPGQVADDAALRLGAGAVADDRALLQAARAAEPGAFLLYKPHPDVVAGLRRGAPGAAALADGVVAQGDMAQLLEQVDALHTIASLSGFEALLRGVPVTCHGLPFYAGWGLTTDTAALPPGRRARRLSLEALVAGALILYPRYVHPASGAPTSPERAVAALAARIGARPQGPLTRAALAAHARWRA